MKNIVLRELYVQNFLSIGEEGLTIDLDRVKSTLIIGDNGAGKTTILEAVTFALYNKTYRKLKQDQIVNAVVQKDCMVKLRFSIANDEYLVIRTLKYSNGVGNSMKLYHKAPDGEFEEMEELVGNGNQERLERIFGIKFNVYKQLIVLGTSGYEEFMRLSVTERRKLIENILGIDIIGAMDEENKGIVKNLNLKINQIESTISGYESEIERGEAMIRRINEMNESRQNNLSQLEKDGQEIKDHLNLLLTQEKLLEEKIALIPEVERPTSEETLVMSTEQKTKIATMVSKIKEAVDANTKSTKEVQSTLTSLQRDVTIFNSVLDMYRKGGKCPSCNQQLSEHDEESKQTTIAIREKEALIEVEKQKLQDLDGVAKDLKEKITKVESVKDAWQREIDEKNVEINQRNRTRLEKYQKDCEGINSLKSELSVVRSKIKGINERIASNDRSIVSLRNEIDNSPTVATDSYDDLPNKIKELNDQKADLLIDITQRAVITNLLKDTGVRADIIDRYIPLFNKSVQKYLDILGADYLFVVDSKFKESILSRGREKFTYESFSRGEQARIDLAILFSWRDIISKVSGFDMSVLFLDEVFDSSTDQQGVEYLKRLLNSTRDDQIIYSISHKEHNPDDFDSVLRVSKRGRFSHYERDYREG